jgi:NAD+ diphosphatase
MSDADQPLPLFTGMTLDRASIGRKDADWVKRRLEDPSSRVVLAGRAGVVMATGPPRAVLRAGLQSGEGDPILLGLEDGAARFAVDLDALPAAERAGAIDGAEVIGLRDAGAVLSASEAGLAAYVMALLNWHRRHRFCANCGHATDIVEAGYSRHCPNCGATHFPRTDPVVIMTVEHDGRLLLGRRAGWPPGRLSVLAGFVSPGESAEEAVVREVQEESGIVSRDPVFVASQPWPFPASLMLGFHAESDGGEPRPTDGELDDVRWLDAAAVRAAAARSDADAAAWSAVADAVNSGRPAAVGADRTDPGVKLPPPVSIARFLIDRWLAEQGA